MSWETSARALQVQGLTSTEKLVLVGIASHDGDGGAWPSVRTLATYASATERTVQRAIAELVKQGWVTVRVNEGGNAHTPDDRRPNLYHLHLDGVVLPVKRNRINGVTTRADGVTSVVPQMSPEQSNELSLELPARKQRAHDSVDMFDSEPGEPGTELALVAGETDAQIAKRICDGYWTWYKERHGGVAPLVNFNGYTNIVRRALAAGHSRRQIQDGLKSLHDRGRTLSLSSLDHELTRPLWPGQSSGVLKTLADLRFDDNGQVISD